MSLLEFITELVASPWAVLPSVIGIVLALLSYWLLPDMPIGFHVSIFGIGALVGIISHFVRHFDGRK